MTQTSPIDAQLPLSGVRVVALEQAVAAPLATRHLADLGAEVVKVERRGEGDFARAYDASVQGVASHFVWLNRGKESIAVDLKSDEGRELVLRLLDEADVFVLERGLDLVQNAIVAEFLRTLEYFDGLLFLTTNRMNGVDEAILARCAAVIEG